MGLVGRINNKHLAKLWNFMVFYNVNSDDNYGDIIEKFQECDEALSELDDQCEHWKTMYANACGDQDVLKESIRLLDGENRRLMAENKDLKKEQDYLVKMVGNKDDELRVLGKQCEDLRKDNESFGRVIKRNIDDAMVDKNAIYQLQKDNEALASAVNSKDDELQVLQKEYDELKKDCEYMTNSRNAWQSRAEHAEAEAEELKKKLTEANEVLDDKEEHTITITMGETNYKILLNILSSKAFGASPKYMRDSLKEFCEDHDSCIRCPLRLRFSNCNFEFMSDEDLEKYYKIAISKYAWHGDATAEKKINKPEE